ncbi:MAG: hypothetical protein J5673_04385 [Candidatus Methanomethylophilaceae archaeon]|nr:hypothetical protein [Candidatus Methanomethylophilaceae archaeon]
MSFFNDTKNAGLILLIIALLEVIFTAIAAFAFEPYKDAEVWKQIMMIVGAVLGAAVFLIVGLGIMKGSCMIQIGDLFSDVSSKFGVVVAVTAAFGLSGIVNAIFTIIGFGGASAIASIVIGVLFILLAWLLATGETDARKVVWIILLILYIIYLIFSIFAALVLVGIPDLLLSIFLVTYLLSPDVKGKCGM